MLSYHYLEHRAEDLAVLRHATYVELPGEDGRVVILVLHLDEHLGCVSCKKQMAPEYIQVLWKSFTYKYRSSMYLAWHKT